VSGFGFDVETVGDGEKSENAQTGGFVPIKRWRPLIPATSVPITMSEFCRQFGIQRELSQQPVSRMPNRYMQKGMVREPKDHNDRPWA
jgi:hypothetical protein